jgi:hypothetical protein
MRACAVSAHPVLPVRAAPQDMLVSQGRSNIRISRIVENAETPLFKSKFFCWDPPASFDFTAPRSSGVAGSADRALTKKEVDAAALHAASASQDMVDDGTGTVTVYRIIDVTMVRCGHHHALLLSRSVHLCSTVCFPSVTV